MNIISRPIATAALLLLCSACGNTGSETEQPKAAPPPVEATASNGVESLKWLEGWWQQVTPGGVIFERWYATENGTLQGSGGFIKGKDTMISETILVEERNGKLHYIPTVKGQNNDEPVPFALTSAVGDSFVFENPAHDFPSKITYRKKSNMELVASISGIVNGKPRSESFELNKAP